MGAEAGADPEPGLGGQLLDGRAASGSSSRLATVALTSRESQMSPAPVACSSAAARAWPRAAALLGPDLAPSLASAGGRSAQVGIGDAGGVGGVVMPVDEGDALAQQAGARVEQGGQDPAGDVAGGCGGHLVRDAGCLVVEQVLPTRRRRRPGLRRRSRGRAGARWPQRRRRAALRLGRRRCARPRRRRRGAAQPPKGSRR